MSRHTETSAELQTLETEQTHIRRTRAEYVQLCVDMMIRHEWIRGKTGRRLAIELGLTTAAVESYAAEAARHLSLIRMPSALREWCLTEARKVLESSDEPMVKLAALKLMLDSQPKGPANGRDLASDVDSPRVEQIRAALRDPDDDLLQALHAERDVILGILSEAE